MILTFIFNILHMILLFIPIAIYFIHEKYVNSWFKYYVLIALLTPLHWEFLNDECIFTVITKQIGDFKNTQTTSSFSEKYLKWLYKPLMDHIFNLKWNNEGLSKMIYIHWIVNFILLWYYIFFIMKK